MLLLQLLEYGVIIWSAWIALATILPLMFNSKGLLLGYTLILVSIPIIDITWVQSEMAKPDWDGQPDIDIIFYIGVIIRIILIMSCLTIVTYISALIKEKVRSRGA